jgi:hypothetical protein
MTVQPLTHHEIVELIAPLTRRGRHLDLAASDRSERRLLFKPIEREHALGECWPLRETLRLEAGESAAYRLTRMLALPNGLTAHLHTEGMDPGELLERLESIPPRIQFQSGPGYRIAHSHRLERAGASLILTRAALELEDLSLLLEVPTVSGVPAEFELCTSAPDGPALPDDVLAVLGWDWGVLARSRGSRRGSLRLRRREPQRSREAERALERAARHLAQTLAEPPRRFHERQWRARWQVVLRRALPLLIGVGLIAGTAALPRLHLAPDSALRMLLFNAPPLLLILVFSLREMPRLEIPPRPRPARMASWRPQGVPEQGSAVVQDAQSN